jgi:RNA polymerase sigma factor (sigma-70 family)
MDAEALLEQAGWMRRLAERLVHDPDRADDMTQETWRIALERKPTFSESPRAWVKTVMQNLARRSHRDEATRAYHERMSARPEAIGPHAPMGPEDETEERVLLQKRLADAILALDEPYRSAIRLRYIDGRSPREVAREQGITYEAARRRLSRAVAMLRERLDRAYGNRSAWGAACVALLKKAAPVASLGAAGALIGSKLGAVAATLIGVAIVGGALWFESRRAAHQDIESAPRNKIAMTPTESMTPGVDEPAVKPSATREVAGVAPRAPVAHTIDRIHDLSGHVLDPRGNPVRGAVVTVLADPLGDFMYRPPESASVRVVAEARTEVDGGFVMTLDRGRPFDIDVHADGYPVEHVRSRYAGEQLQILLHRPSSVSGRVTRAADGSPVGAATVSLSFESVNPQSGRYDPQQSVRTQTDNGGRYHFGELAFGHVRLEVVPPDDPPPTIVRLNLEEGVDLETNFETQTGTTIRGIVVDAVTKVPLAGALVWRKVDEWSGPPRQEVRADASGHFAYTGFPPPGDCFRINGVEVLQARAPGHAVSSALVSQVGAPIPDFVEIELPRARTARGRVVDSRGAPIPGALVALKSNLDASLTTARTASDGVFELDDIATTIPSWHSNPIEGVKPSPRDLQHSVTSASFSLVVRADGFAIRVQAFPAPDEATGAFEFGDITLAPGATFSGRVVDESDHGIRDVLVELRPGGGITGRKARTDEFGRYAFSELQADDYYLVATWPGGRQVDQIVHVAEGEKTEGVWITLPNAESIEGRVLDEDGKGVFDASVSARRQSAPAQDRCSGAARTDASGRFVVRGLTPGVYDLRVEGGAISVGAAELRCPLYESDPLHGISTGDRNVTIYAKRKATLSGRVIDADGNRVGGATVWLEDSSGARVAEKRTYPDGSFGFSVKFGSTLRVAARAPSSPSEERPANDAQPRLDADVQMNVEVQGTRRVILQLPRKP